TRAMQTNRPTPGTKPHAIREELLCFDSQSDEWIAAMLRKAGPFHVTAEEVAGHRKAMQAAGEFNYVRLVEQPAPQTILDVVAAFGLAVQSGRRVRTAARRLLDLWFNRTPTADEIKSVIPK